MKTKSIRQFTLVELLTVVVVMTIIGSITIPLYNRLMTGSAVSYANRLINSQLNMARVHACRKRKPVAVLFADYSLNYNANAVPEEMAQRAFRCAYVTDNAGTWEFTEWVEGSKWEFLPRGAFFTYPNVTGADANAVHDLSSSEREGQGLYPLSATGNSVMKVTDDGDTPYFSSNQSFKFAVIFKENGRPTRVGATKVLSTGNSISTSPKIRIAEGIVSSVDAAKGVTVVKYNPFNYMVSTVNRYTGAVSAKAPEFE